MNTGMNTGQPIRVVWTTRGTTGRRAVDNATSSTESHRRHPRAGDHGGQHRAPSRSLYAGATRGCPQSTAPTTAP